jgi:hypothetical protein
MVCPPMDPLSRSAQVRIQNGTLPKGILFRASLPLGQHKGQKDSLLHVSTRLLWIVIDLDHINGSTRGCHLLSEKRQ